MALDLQIATVVRTAIPAAIKKNAKFYRARLFELAGSRKYSFPALFEIDKKLQRYLDFDNGTFIECGANDGFTHVAWPA